MGTVHVRVEESDDSSHTRLIRDSTIITGQDAGSVGGTVVASVSGHYLVPSSEESDKLQSVLVGLSTTKTVEEGV